MDGVARAWRRAWRLPLVLLHLLLGALVAACLPGRGERVPSAWPMVLWCRVLCRILGLRLTVYGDPLLGRALLVANHVSWLDILCIAAVCPTHFLAKQEVAGWPLIGWLCRRAGTAFIRRGDERGARDAAERLTWRLRRRGGRVLVFPEGTSTDGRGVRRFFPRLFQAAIRARCPVQALALRYPHAAGVHPAVPFVGDDAFVAHLWRVLGAGGLHAELHFLDALPPTLSRDEFARRSHAQILAVVGGQGWPDQVPGSAAIT